MIPQADIFHQFREARLDAASSGFPMGERSSRWRNAPAGNSYRSRDSQVQQSALETSWAVANDLLTKHPLVRVALETFISLSKITEIEPEPATTDPEMNRILSQEWYQYANDPRRCDIEAKRTFKEITAAAVLLTKLHGDAPTPLTSRSQLCLSEAWRLRSPSLGRDDKWGNCGVVRDAQGQEVIRYWLTKTPKNPGDDVRVGDVDSYDVRDANDELIFLLPQPPGRPASRNISALAPVADLLGMWSDGVFVQVVREQVSACLTTVQEISIEGAQQLKELLDLSDTDLKKFFDTDMRTWKMNPGAIINALPGSTWHTLSPNINPANFAMLDELIITALAVNLGCPELAIRLDAKKANFSQYRNVIMQTKMLMAVFHTWWVPQWHRPVYRHVMRNLLQTPGPNGDYARQFVAARGNLTEYLQVEFPSPTWEYIEPVKDATADLLKVGEGLMTQRQWCRTTHGMRLEQYLEEMGAGKKLTLQIAFRIQAELRAEFASDEYALRAINAMHWSEIVAVPQRKAMHVAMPADIDPDLQSDLRPAPAPVKALPAPERRTPAKTQLAGGAV